MNKLEEIEKLANPCLHCGRQPEAFYQDYVGDTYVGDTYSLFCECGIGTYWDSPENLLKLWNRVYEKSA